MLFWKSLGQSGGSLQNHSGPRVPAGNQVGFTMLAIPQDRAILDADEPRSNGRPTDHRRLTRRLSRVLGILMTRMAGTLRNLPTLLASSSVIPEVWKRFSL